MKKIVFQLLMICGLFFLGFVMMSSLQKSMPFSLGIDLVPRWVGTDAILDGVSPYTLEARQRTWRVIYGVDEPRGNVFGFYYPPAITTLLMPFVLANVPLSIATVFFCAFIWSIWLLTLLTVLHGRKVLLFALLLVSGIFFRPAFSNYILGQMTLLGILFLALVYVFIQKQKWVLAGLFLGLSLLKPSFMLLPVGILLILYPNRRFLLSFITISIILNIPSFFLIGWWIPDFIHEISAYTLENKVAWSPANIWSISGLIWAGLSIALFVHSYQKKDTILLISSALALNSVLIPHTADYDLVVFLFPLFWIERKNIPWLLVFIVWLPWASLFWFSDIEAWYNYIWKIYPILILLAVTFIEYLTQRKSFHHTPIPP